MDLRNLDLLLNLRFRCIASTVGLCVLLSACSTPEPAADPPEPSDQARADSAASPGCPSDSAVSEIANIELVLYHEDLGDGGTLCSYGVTESRFVVDAGFRIQILFAPSADQWQGTVDGWKSGGPGLSERRGTKGSDQPVCETYVGGVAKITIAQRSPFEDLDQACEAGYRLFEIIA